MGGSSNNSGSSGGNDGGNNDKPAKKATPKKNNGTSKYFKKTSTPKAKAKKAPKVNYGGNQRANLPSEVAKQYAQPASTRPAVSIVSTAKTSAAPSAKIAKISL